VTGLVIVLVAAALLTGIVAWQRRSLVFAGIALLALGVAVWPWAADETPPSRAAAIERAHLTQAAEDHARDEYEAAVAAIDEWHRVNGPDDPTAAGVAVDPQLAALEGQRLVAARALSEAQGANATAQDAIPPRPADSTIEILRRGLALAISGLGLAVLGAALARYRLRRQQPEPVVWPSIFSPGAPAPPILDRTPAAGDEASVQVAPDGPRTRSQPPVLRPTTPPVPVSTPHTPRKRRRHN